MTAMPSERNNPRRWRLQLRLSTAFLLITIVSLVCAWVIDHRQLRQVINDDAVEREFLEDKLRVSKNHKRAALVHLEVAKRNYDMHADDRAVDRALRAAIRPPSAPANSTP